MQTPQPLTAILPTALPSAQSVSNSSHGTSSAYSTIPAQSSSPPSTSDALTAARGGLPATTHPEALALQSRQPQAMDFLAAYAPDRIPQVMRIADLRRICYGNAPTLSVVAHAYGHNTLLSWLEIQLAALAEYAGVREKMPPQSLHLLAALIARDYWWLKLSEFMHFIGQMMSGTYGHFYGSVDPMVIGEALRRYVAQRQQTMEALDRQDRQREREAEDEARAGKTCSHTQWCARKEIIGNIITALRAKKAAEL